MTDRFGNKLTEIKCGCGKIVFAKKTYTKKELAKSERWVEIGNKKYLCRDCQKPEVIA